MCPKNLHPNVIACLNLAHLERHLLTCGPPSRQTGWWGTNCLVVRLKEQTVHVITILQVTTLYTKNLHPNVCYNIDSCLWD